MCKKIIPTLLLVLSQFVYSQELYVNVGKNFSNYNNTSSITEENYLIRKENRVLDTGNSYAFGLIFNNNKKNFAAYQLGLNYDEFNLTYASSGTSTRYSWQTKYIGIENALLLSLIKSKRQSYCDSCGDYLDNITFILKLGFNASYYLSGYEKANLLHYDISTNKDYKEFVINPIVGLRLSYPLSSISNLHMGYNFIISPYGTDSSNHKVIFTNNISLGLSLSLK